MKKNLILFFLCLWLFAGCISSEPSKNGSALEEVVTALVQPYLDSAEIAGLAIGVSRNDSILLLRSYGKADLEFDVPMPVNASFEIGSVTKQFTAVAIIQLVDKGLLQLDDPLTKYINFDTHGRNVTIYQLLNHTSGIKGYTEMPAFESFSVHKYKRDTLLRIVEKEDFDFEPGEAMIYNNTAFFILGLIIEKVSGKTYEDYLEENIFSKAGMNNTYYCSESKIRKLRAHGYDTGEDGLERAAYLDHTWPYAAGSLCSTVEDLLRWNHVLHKTELVLGKERYSELIEPSRLMDGTELRYSKGLDISDYKGVHYIGHGGGINGFLSDSKYFPDQDIAIVTLINSTGPVGPGGITNKVAEHLLPVEGTPHAEKFPGDISVFEGTYSGPVRGRKLNVTLEAADSVLLFIRGERKDTLRYMGNEMWFMGNQHITFEKDGDQVKEVQVDQVYGYYILKKEE